eukprot:TRINITY_DN43725_c0_g1_i1.p1 TRINITY_DN43725_c0_g1~~TRINITY_DN43725_c0_g1_i1.p1  ORF type:complete len:298 (+),score=62.12 TRINITY_DN43725_c0_g1_i1:17-910(+)
MSLSRHETLMRDTIIWLLKLPEEEREPLEAAENFTFTMSEPAPSLGPPGHAPAGTGVVCATLQMYSVEAAVAVEKLGLSTALLSFAHGYNCGGGFEHASGSQEEDIWRKTTIFLSLWPHRRADDGPGVLKRGQWIGEFDKPPLMLKRKEPYYEHTECGGIYSPCVCILQEGLREDVNVKSLPTIAVLTCAAQNVSFAPPFKPALLKEKCRTVLWMAASKGHEAVVLGAFGCGYFGNPPDDVAEAFAELLGPGGEFAGSFRLAIFAVPRDMNYQYFKDRFPEQTVAQLKAALADATAS